MYNPSNTDNQFKVSSFVRVFNFQLLPFLQSSSFLHTRGKQYHFHLEWSLCRPWIPCRLHRRNIRYAKPEFRKPRTECCRGHLFLMKLRKNIKVSGVILFDTYKCKKDMNMRIWSHMPSLIQPNCPNMFVQYYFMIKEYI